MTNSATLFPGNRPWMRASAGSTCARAGAALLVLLAAAWAARGAIAGEPILDVSAPARLSVEAPAADLQRALEALRPDSRSYIGTLRPITLESPRRLYMALVQPGATDPARRTSAPLSGAGVRNDILFDARAVMTGHTTAFRLLLLDHEYFHARHLAGTTSMPAPLSLPADLQTRFSEAAAWGFNVAEARSGRYPGLRPDEFREALDRYRDHYAALRTLAAGRAGLEWEEISEALRRPGLLRKSAALPPEEPAPPSGPGRSPATR